MFSILALAQEYQSVNGIVTNKIDNTALSNASISLKNHFIGTTSNLQGEFVFSFPSKYSNDTLLVTYLGFETVEIPVSEIKDSLRIALTPKKFLINEIVVKHKDPTWIIEKALQKIPDNYHSSPYNLVAFYRENIKENSDEIQFAEAILEIYKGNTSNNLDKDRIKLLKGRTKSDVKQTVLWEYLRFVDGPYDLLKADVVKNPTSFFSVSQNELNFIHPKYFRYYDYKLMETLDVDKELYAIRFKPKPGKKWVIYEGTIFVEKKSYAIIGIEYTFNVDKINLAQIVDFNTQIALEKAGAIIKAVDFYCFVAYKPYNNKWLYNQATMQYNFVFNEKITKKLFYITAQTNMSITEIKEKPAEKIRLGEQLKFRSTLMENMKNEDVLFWEKYNYIPYEKSNF